MKKLITLSLITWVALTSCKKDTKNATTTTIAPAGAQLKFVFKFDNTQTPLNDSGNVAGIPSTHRAQSPSFNGMSAHYIEMSQTATTQVGAGLVLYSTPTVPAPTITVTSGPTSITYTDAINFSQESIVGPGGQFFSVPLSQVTPGTYQYLRISVAYQNYDIKYAVPKGTQVAPSFSLPSTYYGTGTIASFIGYYTQIGSYTIKTQNVTVGAKQQGYWGFESAPYVFGGNTYTVTPSTGQSPQGATTVVNPLFQTSAIKPGSCLVTGQFVSPTGGTEPLTITGHETSDIVITVSMSTNNSFEWKFNPSNPNDGNIYPLSGDTVVNMGVRGMKPILPQ